MVQNWKQDRVITSRSRWSPRNQCFAAKSTKERLEKQKGEEIENIAGLFKIGNPNISEDAKKKVYEILSRHAKAISTGKRNLGVMRGVEHSIKTKAIQPNQSATKNITLRSEDRSKKECSHLTSSNLPIPIHGPHQW